MNLLGSVGDLYCFSNTFSMLLYVAPLVALLLDNSSMKNYDKESLPWLIKGAQQMTKGKLDTSGFEIKSLCSSTN